MRKEEMRAESMTESVMQGGTRPCRLAAKLAGSLLHSAFPQSEIYIPLFVYQDGLLLPKAQLWVDVCGVGRRGRLCHTPMRTIWGGTSWPSVRPRQGGCTRSG